MLLWKLRLRLGALRQKHIARTYAQAPFNIQSWSASCCRAQDDGKERTLGSLCLSPSIFYSPKVPIVYSIEETDFMNDLEQEK